MPSNPSPAEILAARKAAGLSQVAAAALIYSTRRTWQDWEAGISGMHPGLFDYFLIKSGPDRRALGPPPCR
jgi:DNA-binding XRE family transcriptional regulator